LFQTRVWAAGSWQPLAEQIVTARSCHVRA
jgi:hypothetical protein